MIVMHVILTTGSIACYGYSMMLSSRNFFVDNYIHAVYPEFLWYVNFMNFVASRAAGKYIHEISCNLTFFKSR